MERSTNLDLPFILAGQAQKHVTHNEAIAVLDALLQLVVISRVLASPPEAPGEGDRYIIPQGATLGWESHQGQIASYQDNHWTYFDPKEGWVAWCTEEAALIILRQAGWAALEIVESVNPVEAVGINSVADDYNKLSVRSAASLFNHQGNGHRLVINKNNEADTASVIWQNNYSGRSELGLNGNDDLSVKVSPDGGTWLTAYVIRATNAFIGIGKTAPTTQLDIAGAIRCGQYSVSSLPSAGEAGAGSMIYVVNEGGGPVLAFSDGSSWRRTTDRNIVS